MTSQILKGILYLLSLLSLCERLVCGNAALSQKTTVDECDYCELLKTVINTQNEISQQNKEQRSGKEVRSAFWSDSQLLRR